MKKYLDTIASIVVIGVALLVGGLVVKKHLRPGQGPIALTPPEIVPPGTALPVAGVDWRAHRQSVVLVLSTRCSYCGDGAPFYRRLAESAASQGFQLVAVFPEAVEESRKYLEGLGVPIAQVKRGGPEVLKLVKGTPTLLLVDREGKVERAWRGRLRSDREEQILAALAPRSQSSL